MIHWRRTHPKEQRLAANCHRAAWGVPRCRLLTGCLQCLAKLLNKQEDMVWAGDLTPELLSSLLCWR